MEKNKRPTAVLYRLAPSPEFVCSYGHFSPPMAGKGWLYPNQRGGGGVENDAKNQIINLQ